MVKIQTNNQGKAYYTSSGKVLIANEPLRGTSLEVSSGISDETFTPQSPYNAFTEVTVNGDQNLISENIKKKGNN